MMPRVHAQESRRDGRRARSWLRRRLELREGNGADGRQAAMARAAFYLYLAGGTLGLLSLTLAASAREEPAVAAASLGAFALAALYLVGFDRLPGWVYHVTTVCATAIIAVATHFGGDAALAYLLFYLWVVLYALYFFRLREAAAHIMLVVVAYMVVLELASRPQSPVQTLVAGGTALVAGAAALLVKARLEGLLEKLDGSNRRLRRQNARLRELDRQKDELVSLVSHELKTPLTSVRGYLDLILEDMAEFDDEHRRFLEVLDRSVDRLLKVVEDLLFLARVNERTLTLETQWVDLPAVVGESASRFAPLAEQKDLALTWVADPLPPLRADGVRLAQLVDNLVSNAIKFTPRGGNVEIDVRASEGGAAVRISDSGIGVPASDQSRVFERFFRASNSDEGTSAGTGLGLTIAKAITEAHGGELRLESTEGAGTTITATFPLRTTDENIPALVAVDARGYGSTRAAGGR